MNKRIENYKELLEVLPRNNIKNAKAYVKKALLMKQAALEYKKELLKVIHNRYYSLLIKDENEQIKIKESYLKDIKDKLYLLNDNDSYEKSSLDKMLYDLKKFYKDDLVKANQNIEKTLNKFEVVGVKLESKDFNYKEEVNEYMTLFIKEKNVDSVNLKELFDKLYWKCPNILENIYLNFRHLYFKNQKTFDKYYNNKLKEANLDLLKINNTYKEYLELQNKDIKKLQDKFLNNELDIKEYDDNKINKLRDSLIIKSTTEDEENNSIQKLSYTLFEYKNYLRFKPVIDEVKKIYNEKNNNKNLTKSILKKINKCEKNIKKANRTFFKLKEEKKRNIIEKNLQELKELYKEYDEDKFKEKIATKLNDDSTILDALELVNSYKINLSYILRSINEEIEDEEIKKEEEILERFLVYPNNNLINNIAINDDTNVTTIILDKYKLMNINLSSEQLEETNIDIIISTVNKVLISDNLKKNKISYDTISSLCEMNKILEKENMKEV